MKIDFAIVGAQKAGTSALRAYLSQHPDIFMPIKEPEFFQKNAKISVEEHNKLFEDANENQLLGEKTPSYMYDKFNPKLLFNNNSKMKIIVLVRNPIKRAFSEYKMIYGVKNVDDPFEEVIKKKTNIIEKGKYSKYIKRYYKYFPKEQVKVIISERLRKERKEVIKETFAFLGVDSSYVPKDLKEKNIGIYKTNKLTRILLYLHFKLIGNTNNKCIKKICEMVRNTLSGEREEDKLNEMKNIFEKNNKELNNMIEKDLDAWWKRSEKR